MDKSTLPVAALVAGLLALAVGSFAYMEASKAGKQARSASSEVEEAESGDALASRVKKALSRERTRSRAEIRKMVETIERRLGALEKRAEADNTLDQAKSFTMKSVEATSQELFSQAKELQKEIDRVDGKIGDEVIKLKAAVLAELEETRKALKRTVQRWMESGAM